MNRAELEAFERQVMANITKVTEQMEDLLEWPYVPEKQFTRSLVVLDQARTELQDVLRSVRARLDAGVS